MAMARHRRAVGAALIAAAAGRPWALLHLLLRGPWQGQPCEGVARSPLVQPLRGSGLPRPRLATRRALASSLSRPGGARPAGDEATQLISRLLETAEGGARKDNILKFLSEDGERCSQLSGAILDYARARANGETPDELEALEASGAIRRIVFEASVIVRKLYGDTRQDLFTEEMEPLFELLSRF
eukprot:CAMPEP_0175212754 /NCGR_PEP_ID=MMETSP0093-20121207/15839_1 /TAXON_ID=311494 /ORGANISM="Alexandrium monilatum, Strain CCMP3105" /LENGTH=184 /DNA_ID=CAMNT_0016506055 /DNA_START=22 /DNA_END=576 /DNA_ORIENTATION=-